MAVGTPLRWWGPVSACNDDDVAAAPSSARAFMRARARANAAGTGQAGGPAHRAPDPIINIIMPIINIVIDIYTYIYY